MKRQKTSDPDIVRYESGVYYFRRGQKEISLRTSEFKEARERKILLESRLPSLIKVNLKLRFKDVLPSYLEARERDFSSGDLRASTLKLIRYLLDTHLTPYFGSMKLSTIDSIAWEEFKKGSSLRDFSNARNVMSHFFKWCKMNNYSHDIPILQVKKVQRRKRRILKPGEMRSIWESSQGSLRLFIALALFMGMRRSEIMTLQWKHVDLVRRCLVIPESVSKTRKGRKIPINSVVFQILQERAIENAQVSSRWVFPNRSCKDRHGHLDGLKTAWRTCKRNAGLGGEDITWHDLRATCEAHAHKRTDLTPTQLEKFFGASIDVQRKIYVSLDEDDLRGVEESVIFSFSGETSGKGQEE